MDAVYWIGGSPKNEGPFRVLMLNLENNMDIG